MNKTPEEAMAFVKEFKSAFKPKIGRDIIFLPSILSLAVFKQEFNGTPITFGAQNCHFEASGAFTGEVSAGMLKSMGAKYCLVGHSERRHIFKETDADLAKKVKALQEQDITPILCVGETEAEKNKGETLSRVESQVELGLASHKKGAPLVIAYEPVWSIGTGKVPTLQDIQQVHAHIQKVLGKVGVSAPILYGGSVNPQNSKELEGLQEVNGFLIGGASLKVPSLLEIY